MYSCGPNLLRTWLTCCYFEYLREIDLGVEKGQGEERGEQVVATKSGQAPCQNPKINVKSRPQLLALWN